MSAGQLAISSNACERAYDVDIVLKDGAPWFRASDVTKVLGYVNGPQAVSHNVKAKYTATKEQLCMTGGVVQGIYTVDTLKPESIYGVDTSKCGRRGPHSASLYIAEPGLYALILRSKKKEAEDFQDWVNEKVLPEIRAKGSYQSRKPQTKLQICLISEFDLHAKIIDFVRRFHPEANIVAGMGELQDSEEKRIKSWQMGYTRGQCDILLLNRHKKYTGLAIELKSPTGWGVVSPDQQKFLERLKGSGYKTLISNDYDDVIVQIGEYFREVQSFCEHCGRWFLKKHSHK